MGLSTVPASERVHIGFFGKRNAGKSSVMNAVTGQNLAIVSEQKGTTTDPVFKTMEILPLGPVMLMDTPGLDDEGELGKLRVKKAYQALNKTDIALLVIDAAEGISAEDVEILRRIRKKEIPFLVVMNKEELLGRQPGEEIPECGQDEGLKDGVQESGRNKAQKGSVQEKRKQIENSLAAAGEADLSRIVWVSAAEKTGIEELKERMARLLGQERNERRIVGDIIHPGEMIVLVVPIDKAAPKGRLILPQQQTIRDILESGASAVVVRDLEYREMLEKLGRKPELVITDSQVFERIAAETPEELPLTSFSILFARYKGILFPAVRGARTLETLQDGDRVLISEGCTHHRQCEDIGTVKLPGWITRYTGKKLDFSFTSGTEFPDELRDYRLIVHCGGCMLNEREMNYRLSCAEDQTVPMTNYGILIAYMQGILERCIRVFEAE